MGDRKYALLLRLAIRFQYREECRWRSVRFRHPRNVRLYEMRERAVRAEGERLQLSGGLSPRRFQQFLLPFFWRTFLLAPGRRLRQRHCGERGGVRRAGTLVPGWQDLSELSVHYRGCFLFVVLVFFLHLQCIFRSHHGFIVVADGSCVRQCHPRVWRAMRVGDVLSQRAKL